MIESPWHYWADVVGVVDGNLICANIDLGFGTCQMAQRVRLYGISAPEHIRGDDPNLPGAMARTMLENKLLSDGPKIILETIKDKDSPQIFGIVFKRDRGHWVDVNAWMVATGHAVES